MSKKSKKYIIGIDEAGRGPLAGPIAIGAVLFRNPKHLRYFSGIRDSKKLTKAQRENWYSFIKGQKRKNRVDYKISSVSPKVIDKRGLTYATKCAIKRCLRKLEVGPRDCKVYLDGSLRAPENFIYQKTITRGDDKLRCISIAAVVAKVFRDKKMTRYSKIFPKYGFELHKGYGTSLHVKRIKKYGPSIIHRKSFLKNLTNFRY